MQHPPSVNEMSHGRDRSRALVGSNAACSRSVFVSLLLLVTLAEVGAGRPEDTTRPLAHRLGRPTTISRKKPSLGQVAVIQPRAQQGPATGPPGGYATGSSGAGGDKGGTACQCVCGDRVVWHREVFQGNVVREKEHECEHQICPRVTVPGLRVKAQCTYVEDIAELTAGTVCNCQCGDRIVWRNRAFYGDVREKMERECLKKICPRVNPVPGYRFYSHCIFDKHLFAAPVQQPKALAARGVVSVGALIMAWSSLAWAGLLF